MNTFIHHDGALGDVLLSLSCIVRIAAQGGALHFAGRGDIGVLLRESGLVAEFSSTAGGRHLSLHSGPADAAAQAFLSRFERAFLFTVDPDSSLAGTVRSIIPHTRVIMTVPPAESAVHVAKFRLDQMEDGVALPQGPLLPVPLLHRELAAGMLARASYDGSRPVIAVHPGSGGKAKQWPLDSYLQLLEELRAGLGPFLVIFSGPAEDDAAKDRLDAFARGRTGAVHIADADLPAVAALLRSADLYIGNDSGVSHLAAAAGCRVIALFGPTDPARWRPVGEAVEVIRSPELADLPVSKVFDRVRDILAAAGAEPPGRKKDNGGSEES